MSSNRYAFSFIPCDTNRTEKRMSESPSQCDDFVAKNQIRRRSNSFVNAEDHLFRFRQVLNLTDLMPSTDSISSPRYFLFFSAKKTTRFSSLIYLDQWVNFWKNLKQKNTIPVAKMKIFDTVLDLCKAGGKAFLLIFSHSNETF